MAKWAAQFGPTGDDDPALVARDEETRRVLHVCSIGQAVRVSVHWKAATLTATGDRLRSPDQLRRSPVARDKPIGVQSPDTLTDAGRKFSKPSRTSERAAACVAKEAFNVRLRREPANDLAGRLSVRGGVPRTPRVRDEELSGKVKASFARNAEGDPEILEGDAVRRGEVQLSPARQKSLCRHIDQAQPVSVLPLES